ncbi:kin of IRRE-like protein 3 isoform X1 [Amphibalanus amphitrite]|uniref:kin of IRRE-like protein 3 isoform X1 n=1 Tax=Amphibalanus amphitrite TaxID=1232801 RepID=UPI001C9048C0|nr:kin of IRRE-like protein 3 isoform X1 [Amphibalanus amphitrite]
MGTQLLGTAVLLLTALSAAGALQTFEQQPQYTEVNPGQTTVLHCKVYNKAGQCSWQKDGYPIGPEQDKYEWAESPDQGDCSIRIIGADLKYDDGLWICQVTSSSFQTQDALKSAPAHLVVRVEPQVPQMEHRAATIGPGQNLTVRAGEEVDVQCRARYGNPPAIIKWFIGDKDLTHLSTQRNQTELDNPKTSAALSVLRHSFGRAAAGDFLRCVAVHQAYDTKSRDTIAKLDVQYSPEVRLAGRPDRDLEENVDSVVLRCVADANPPANVFWRFVSRDTGRTETFYVDTLELRPVTRKNSGTYQCEAGNTVGKSEPLTTALDIKFAPSIYRVQPERRVTVDLYNTTELACDAEGSPPPSYQWLQRLPDGQGTVFIRGTSQVLRIHNITYANQGQYVCVAKNVINGNERRVQGDAVDVEVVGPPQVLRRQATPEVLAEEGREAVLEVTFCSDPLPTLSVWHWGSLQLQTGHSQGRFVAEQVTQDSSEDCYVARLRLQGVEAADERDYLLKVQNDRGSDQYGVSLRVKEPVTMATLISLVCGCLVALVLVVALLLYAFKKEKWCFSQKGGFKPTDLESEKSEVESRTGESGARQGLGAIPPDALYSGPKKSAAGALHTNGHGSNGRAASGDPHKYRGEDGDCGQSDSSRGGIIYADLQLPKTSNNGSMRKHRHERHLPYQDQRHLPGSSRSEPTRTEYAEIKFVPKIDERADI